MAEVDIINLAFTDIGEDIISSAEWALGASGTYPRTRKAYAVYALVRDGVMRSHLWNCCLKDAEIMEDTTANPIHSYDNQFSLPADFLRMHTVHPRDKEIAYKIRGRKLLTNETSGPDSYSIGTYYEAGKYLTYSDVTYLVDTAFTASDWTTDAASYLTSQSGDYDVLDISYVYKNTDDTTWDALLKSVVSTQLAIKLAITLSADKAIYDRLLEYYTKILLPQCKSVDAMEETPDAILTQTWLNEMD